jgi:glycerol-3-phosphate dehydrogenase (NAD(P)+)
MKLAILGAGAWGTALGIALASRHQISVWGRDPVQCRRIAADHLNARYLPDVEIPASVHITADINSAIHGSELIIAAVPTSALRQTLKLVASSGSAAGLVWLCKGFETGTAKFPHQVAEEELRSEQSRAVLSGPSFASEVARGLPAAVTLASRDPQFATLASRQLHTGRFRVYSSDDVIGVETGGAVKNVIAIAAGVCDGLRLGASARAALITRGLAEVTRLGIRLGGRFETFIGLAGAGDLMLTATSDLSRNRRVGLQLALGQPLAAILEALGHVAEGVYTAREVLRLSERLGIDMPITAAVSQLLGGAASARDVVDGLLQRGPKQESVR